MPKARAWAMKSRAAVAVGVTAPLVVGVFFVLPQGAALGEQSFNGQVTLDCAFPSGTQPVEFNVQGALPRSVNDGASIQPTKVTTSVTLPASALATLPKLANGPIGGSIRLAMYAKQDKQDGRIVWPAFPLSQGKAKTSSPLTMHASGEVPPIKQASVGSLALSIQSVALTLVPKSGTTAQIRAAATSVLCQASGTKAAKPLASVNVQAADAAEGSQSAPGCPSGTPKTLNPDLPMDSTPTGNSHGPYATAAAQGAPFCVAQDARSNVTKLNAATELHGHADIMQGTNGWTDYSQTANGVGQIGHEGSPAIVKMDPATGTFLGFGFTPVTATVTLKQIGTANALTILPTHMNTSGSAADSSTQFFPIDEWPAPKSAGSDLYGEFKLTISNASVNGVKLNLGSSCRTVTPLQLHLHGDQFSDIPFDFGGSFGMVQGTFTIPKFTGCGVGENLTPLLNASIAGSNNYAQALVGPPCQYATTGEHCPALHRDKVSAIPAGTWDSSPASVSMDFWEYDSPDYSFPDSHATEIDCTSQITASLTPGLGLGIGIGKVSGFSFDNCTSDGEYGYPPVITPGPVQISSPSFPWSIDIYPYYIPPFTPGQAAIEIRGAALRLSVAGCQVDFSSLIPNAIPSSSNALNGSYDDASNTLDLGTSFWTVKSVSGCAMSDGSTPKVYDTLAFTPGFSSYSMIQQQSIATRG